MGIIAEFEFSKFLTVPIWCASAAYHTRLVSIAMSILGGLRLACDQALLAITSFPGSLVSSRKIRDTGNEVV